ncbi:MAG: SDR family oxidoreductase [Methanocellales archaeon]|nr:SDR family oxidoreductase [Methanocellales archaeon]MDD5446380.1 SDR family oxidoreductase [Methanocellales archaeon]
MKTVLVTGGAGFIGSHLCEKLLVEGHKVICLDDLSTGNENNIHHLLSDAGFTYLKQDIVKSLKITEKIDHIFHLASPASPVDYQRLPIETLLAGSFGTNNALELAKEKGAVLLLASTSEVYGDPAIHPQREDYWGNVNPIGPRSCYDEAKRFAEALTMAYHRKYDLNVRIVRIFNTYGQRMRKDDGRAIPNFITQAMADEPITVYGDGSQTRSFCYISDMVEGMYRAMFSKDMRGEVVNLGNQSEIPVLELAERIKSTTKSHSKIVFKKLPEDDPKQRCPDTSKAKEILGWEPVVDLEEGLNRTIRWFEETLEPSGHL